MRDHRSRRVENLLFMRQFPGFAEAEVSELAAFAENTVERRHAAGAFIGGPDRPAAIHMVIDGRLASPGGARTWTQRQAVGALDVIAGRRTIEPVIAVEETRTLELAADDFLELLADNHSVLIGARRILANRLLAAAPHAANTEATSHEAGVLLDGGHPRLDPVRRLQLLRHCLSFPPGYIQALAALARASVEEHHPAGTVLQTRGDAAETITVVVHGLGQVIDHVDCQTFGRLETLGGARYATTVEATTPVRVLRVPSAALVDIMEDHTDFSLALIADLASAVLALEGRGGDPN